MSAEPSQKPTTIIEKHDYSSFQDTEPVGDILPKITALAIAQKEAEAKVADLEEKLKAAKAEVVDISEFKLPELMDSIQMKKFTLQDGSEVEVAEKIRASIPSKFLDRAMKWLEDNEHENIIKEQFTVDFDQEDREVMDDFASVLAKDFGEIRQKHKRSVHASTLASFVKGQLEEGVEIPFDLFGVFRQRFTKVTSK